MAESGEPTTTIPNPPFDETTPYGDGETVACFLNGCKRKFNTFHSLMMHIKLVHRTMQTVFKGTYFYDRYCEENKQKQKDTRAKRKQKKLALVPAQTQGETSVVPRAPTAMPTAIVPTSASSSTTAPDMHPFQMVAEMYSNFKEKQKESDAEKNWRDRVPTVAIKRSYVEWEAPRAKREGVGRATWPTRLRHDAVQLDDFQRYLADQYKGTVNAKVIVLGASRALGMLDFDSDGDVDITDVKILVGFYISKQYTELVDIPLLHPKFHWTHRILEGFACYAAFWIWRLKNMIIQGEQGPLQKYIDCLECVIANMKSGHSRRCKEYKEFGYQETAREDAEIIRNFPSIKDIVQPSVRRAYCILKRIATEYAGGDVLPPRERALANATLIGAWHYDTFMGRKWEIEHALLTDIDKMLNDGYEYLLCRQHKTHKTYGEIIKYITPGLREAIIAYRSLPRPDGFEFFLVPMGSTATNVSIPTSLKTFNKKFMPSAKVSPSTNQIRKLFHRELKQQTKNEERVKEFMTILDAHGRTTIDKHYLIKTPEDDLAIAKVLVNSILGTTVSWPYDDDGDEVVDEIMTSEHTDTDACDDDDEDDDDEPLEYWPFGGLFGVLPLGHLHVLHDKCDDASTQMVPYDDKTAKRRKRRQRSKSDAAKSPKRRKARKANRTQAAASPADGETLSPTGTVERADVSAEPPRGTTRGATRKATAHADVASTGRPLSYTDDQASYYAKYEHVRVPGRRHKVADTAHVAIHAALLQWQRENGAPRNEKPKQNEWYWTLRCKLIEEGFLSTCHCWDVCRNSVKTFLKNEAKRDDDVE